MILIKLRLIVVAGCIGGPVNDPMSVSSESEMLSWGESR